jgi:hypothetical protein
MIATACFLELELPGNRESALNEDADGAVTEWTSRYCLG